MEDVTVTVPGEKIREALVKVAEDVFKSSYDNPIRKAMESAIKEQSGTIKMMVDDVITNAISNPEFKAKLGDMVLKGMIELALKR